MLEPTLDNTLGALQIGSLFATFLFGIITYQTQHYIAHFPDDKIIYKITVTLLWFCELAHTIGTAYEVYRNSVQPPSFNSFPGLYVSTLMSGIITMTVHIYLSLRIHKALKSPWNHLIGLTPIVLTIARMVATVVLVVKLYASDNFLEITQKLNALVTALLSGGAGIDVVLAVGMSYYLSTQREKSFKSVRKLIDRLIIFTIRSGLLTSITAVAMLTVFQIIPRTFIWLAIYTCLAKLYSITMLSALNGREDMRHTISSNPVTGSDIPSIGSRTPKYNVFQQSFGHGRNCACGCNVRSPGAITIEMKTTTDISRKDQTNLFHSKHDKDSDDAKTSRLSFSA